MGRLIDFLVQNPILILILVAWLAGIAGNAGKAARKARERAERAQNPPPPQPAQARPPAQPAAPGTRSAEEVAREMRRILGLDRDEEPQRPVARPAERPVERPVERTLEPQRSRAEQLLPRREVSVERPPAPVKPTTQERRITVHVDPHVGDRIAARQAPQSGLVGRHEPGSSLGSLGGRVAGPTQRRRTSRRFALDNIPKAFVLSEILGKPLALRDSDNRFV